MAASGSWQHEEETVREVVHSVKISQFSANFSTGKATAGGCAERGESARLDIHTSPPHYNK